MLDLAPALIAGIVSVTAAAPFRRYRTPGGRPLSAEMSGAGDCAWVSDAAGYRYADTDPLGGRPWPAMPPAFVAACARAAEAAGFAGFAPDSCLINRYAPGAGMGLHRDRDERDMDQPIVSLSLGLPATFLWAGDAARGSPLRLPLRHGDALAWGGPARLGRHGVAPVPQGHHPATGAFRYNLTFRRAR